MLRRVPGQVLMDLHRRSLSDSSKSGRLSTLFNILFPRKVSEPNEDLSKNDASIEERDISYTTNANSTIKPNIIIPPTSNEALQKSPRTEEPMTLKSTCPTLKDHGEHRLEEPHSESVLSVDSNYHGDTSAVPEAPSNNNVKLDEVRYISTAGKGHLEGVRTHEESNERAVQETEEGSVAFTPKKDDDKRSKAPKVSKNSSLDKRVKHSHNQCSQDYCNLTISGRAYRFFIITSFKLYNFKLDCLTGSPDGKYPETFMILVNVKKENLYTGFRHGDRVLVRGRLRRDLEGKYVLNASKMNWTTLVRFGKLWKPVISRCIAVRRHCSTSPPNLISEEVFLPDHDMIADLNSVTILGTVKRSNVSKNSTSLFMLVTTCQMIYDGVEYRRNTQFHRVLVTNKHLIENLLNVRQGDRVYLEGRLTRVETLKDEDSKVFTDAGLKPPKTFLIQPTRVIPMGLKASREVEEMAKQDQSEMDDDITE